MGGKAPESAHMRLHLNRLDALGIDDPNSSRMIEEMKDMHLPEKMDETSLQSLHTGSSSSQFDQRGSYTKLLRRS